MNRTQLVSILAKANIAVQNGKITKANVGRALEAVLDERANSITGFINCRIFVQELTGISNIEGQPRVSKPSIGDILWWGDEKHGYRHVAVYAGEDQVWQVDSWGASPEKIPMKKVTDYWDKPDRIYKGAIKV